MPSSLLFRALQPVEPVEPTLPLDGEPGHPAESPVRPRTMGRTAKPQKAKAKTGAAQGKPKPGKRTHAKRASSGPIAGMMSPAAKSAAIAAAMPKTPSSCLRKTALLAGASKGAGGKAGASICWSPTLVTRKETTWSAEQYDRSPCAQPKIYCCDYCTNYFRGTRHHCEECEDFDVCVQ